MLIKLFLFFLFCLDFFIFFFHKIDPKDMKNVEYTWERIYFHFLYRVYHIFQQHLEMLLLTFPILGVGDELLRETFI